MRLLVSKDTLPIYWQGFLIKSVWIPFNISVIEILLITCWVCKMWKIFRISHNKWKQLYSRCTTTKTTKKEYLNDFYQYMLLIIWLALDYSFGLLSPVGNEHLRQAFLESGISGLLDKRKTVSGTALTWPPSWKTLGFQCVRIQR